VVCAKCVQNLSEGLVLHTTFRASNPTSGHHSHTVFTER
jgi:hypothetical protein